MQRNYTVKSLASEWGVNESTVYKLIDQRQLGCLRIGKAIRITPAMVEAYEQQHTHEASTCREEDESKPSTTRPEKLEVRKTTTSVTPKVVGLSAFQRGQTMSRKPSDITINL